jgi:hypothetical protein
MQQTVGTDWETISANTVYTGNYRVRQVSWSSQIGCPTKLVSIRNNRNWNRNMFRHYLKQVVCFGCFDLISKQRVSVFRLNRNNEEGTETNRKRRKIGKNIYSIVQQAN